MHSAAGGGLWAIASVMLAACGAAATSSAPAGSATPRPAASTPATAQQPTPAGTPTVIAPAKAGTNARNYWLYAFNTGSMDVSIIDTAKNSVIATRPLGAAIRWLSNEQSYWDGKSIWTYDFPDNKLQALAIDPNAVAVVKRIDTGTTGPGHSLVLSPDKQTGYLNAAGSNVLNVLDLAAGSVKQQIDTGQFP